MTLIQWTDETWNPIAAFDRETGKRGWFCVHASTGCLNCYAELTNGWRGNGHRYRLPELEKLEIRIVEHVLRRPLHWKAPRMVFPCSMTDLFFEGHSDRIIDRCLAIMAQTPQHTYQVLTKRAKRMREYFTALAALTSQQRAVRMARSMYAGTPTEQHIHDDTPGNFPWPLPNVWVGVSTENQKAVDERVPELLAAPVGLRWISAEPLLEDITIEKYIAGETRLDWVVIGGESGARAREFRLSWPEALLADCMTYGVRAFVKQLGAKPYDDRVIGADAPLKLKDGHGGVLEEWPFELRVREFPERAE